MLTTTERKIAYLAIMPRTGMSREQLAGDIVQESATLRLDLTPSEIVKMLEDLVTGDIIRARASTVRTTNSSEPQYATNAWFEKGTNWPSHMSVEEASKSP